MPETRPIRRASYHCLIPCHRRNGLHPEPTGLLRSAADFGTFCASESRLAEELSERAVCPRGYPDGWKKEGPIAIDGNNLTLEQVEQIADGAPVKLLGKAKSRIRASRRVVERVIATGEQVYGINTGFGHLARVRIPDDQLDQLQRNLIRSHCAGVGEPFSERVVRGILALRANCLSRGHSGLRLEVLERLIEFLNRGIHPVVPKKGSVGASGDLAPLAHIALAIMGEGRVFYRGKIEETASVLKRLRLAPIQLLAKEGLALINGTQVRVPLAFGAARRGAARSLCRHCRGNEFGGSERDAARFRFTYSSRQAAKGPDRFL